MKCISRRQFLQISFYGLVSLRCYAAPVTAVPWQSICKQWLNLFIPKDAAGIGADCDAVWSLINSLVQDPQFKRGFIAGLRASAQLPKPNNAEDLEKIMSGGREVTGFLNAFFEIVIEGFYGAAVGYKDIGLNNAPQPQGYLITFKQRIDS